MTFKKLSYATYNTIIIHPISIPYCDILCKSDLTILISLLHADLTRIRRLALCATCASAYQGRSPYWFFSTTARLVNNALVGHARQEDIRKNRLSARVRVLTDIRYAIWLNSHLFAELTDRRSAICTKTASICVISTE